MIKSTILPLVSSLVYSAVKTGTGVYGLSPFPIVSTGRSFEYYRKIFFENKSEHQVLTELKGKVIADIGCGLTPYVSDSMFQACRRKDIAFYGIDPKLENGFKFGLLDMLKVRIVGGGEKIDPDARGLEKGIGTLADDLPFDDDSVDLVLSNYAMYAWINDDAILEGIFEEFHRVLKPGGKVMIYPTPHLITQKPKNASFREIMSGFEIEQKFGGDTLLFVKYPPAYMTTYIKR